MFLIRESIQYGGQKWISTLPTKKQKVIAKHGTLVYSSVDHDGSLRVYLVCAKISGTYHLHVFLQTRYDTIDKSFNALEDILNLSTEDPLSKYKEMLADIWKKRTESAT